MTVREFQRKTIVALVIWLGFIGALIWLNYRVGLVMLDQPGFENRPNPAADRLIYDRSIAIMVLDAVGMFGIMVFLSRKLSKSRRVGPV